MGDYSIDWDAKLPGFGIRTTKDGVRSFILNYRTRSGRQRRYTIGRYGKLNKEAARAIAKDLLAKIAQGADPLADKIEAREADAIADLWQRYEAEHLPAKRPASQVEDRAMYRAYIQPALAQTKVRELDYAVIARLHSKITKGDKGKKIPPKPVRANRTIALLSKMMALSIRWGMRADNPCHGIAKNSEEGRERYLTPEETARLMAELARLEDQEAANAIMLALLTGARKSEIVLATWDQFDLAKGVWDKPAAYTKQKRRHMIRLSSQARQLLGALYADRRGETFVFPTRARADNGKGSIRYSWEKVRERAGIPDVRTHDLRHSVASFLASEGYSLPVIGRMLGHTQAQTTMRYAHLHDDAMEEAANSVGARIVSGVDNSKKGAE